MIGWDKIGNMYHGVYRDPTEGEKQFEIGASEQADGSWAFTLFCPFGHATTRNGKEIPSRPKLGIQCSACGRFYPFRFPIQLAARQVGALNLRAIPIALRNDFKALCARHGTTMSNAIDIFMRAAVSGAVDINSLAGAQRGPKEERDG